MSSIYAAKFQLGHALVHSLDRSDIPSGIQILEELVKKHHDSDARRDYSKYGSIKWGASSRWSSSLSYPMWNSGGMKIGKMHPTLVSKISLE